MIYKLVVVGLPPHSGCWTHYMTLTYPPMMTLTYDLTQDLDLGLCIFYTEEGYPRPFFSQPDLIYFGFSESAIWELSDFW